MKKNNGKNIIAIYPGSFDPLTNGHLDIITRASSLFDKVIVAIADNSNKSFFIPIAKRVSLTKQVITKFDNVVVKSFDNLLIKFANSQNARIIIRGLRAVSDFEYEFRLSGMNRNLDNNIETLFMTPSEEYSNISSSLIKEIIMLQGDVKKFIPSNINDYMLKNI